MGLRLLTDVMKWTAKGTWKLLADPYIHKNKGADFLKPGKMRKVLRSENKGLLIDGVDKRLSEEDSFKHLALISPTGAGKTTRFVIPNVLSLNHCSMVMTDPSGEIYKQTSAHLKKKGYTLQVVNPRDPRRSVCYNPLARVNSYQDASEVAHILVKSAHKDYDRNQYWFSGAENLISILIQVLHAMKERDPSNEKHFNLHNVLHLAQHCGGSTLDPFISANAPQHVFNQWRGFITGNPKVTQTFVGIATQALKDLNDPDTAQMLSQDELDFRALRKRKTAIFIIIPSEKLSNYSFLMSLLYTQLFHTLMEDIPGGRELPVYALLDEAGHSPLPELETIITTARKFEISISLIYQSLAQLEILYGREGARTIYEGGINSRLVYPGLDIQAAEMVSRMLGKMQFEQKNSQGGKYMDERNLMNPDRIRTMDKDKAIFMTSNSEPIKLGTKPCFKNYRFRSMTSKPPVDIPVRSRGGSLSYINV